MKYFVVDENKNLVEALSKEDVYSILEQAIEDGDLSHIEEDSAFVSKLKEANSNNTVRIWLGTMAEFNAIATKDPNTLYIFTDDDSADSWDEIADQVRTNKDDIESLSNNIQTMPKLKKATYTNFYDLTMKLYSIVNLNMNNLPNIVKVSLKFNDSILGTAHLLVVGSSSPNTISTAENVTFFESQRVYNLTPTTLNDNGFNFITDIRYANEVHQTSRIAKISLSVNTSNQEGYINARSSGFDFDAANTKFDFRQQSITSQQSSQHLGEFTVMYYEEESTTEGE